MKLSKCCGGRLIGGIQCEICGADGRELEREAEELRQEELERLEDEKFDYHPRPEEEN